MTKYFLNSGAVGRSKDKGRAFFNDVLNGFGQNPELLICVFAQPREDWEDKFNQDIELFKEIFDGDVKPVLTLAFPEKFEEQIKRSDAVYIHGGDDHLIQYWLRQFDLPRIWDGKAIATNSASSHALSECFWTCDWRMCMKGLGVLSIKFMSHFKSAYGENDPRGPIDWDESYKELENYGDANLPIYALEEGEYKIFEI